MEAGGPGSNWTVCFTGLKNIVTKAEVRELGRVRSAGEGTGGSDFSCWGPRFAGTPMEGLGGACGWWGEVHGGGSPSKPVGWGGWQSR